MPTRRLEPERVSKGHQRLTTLLRAGERLLESGEFADASVSDLATAAGLSRASFYFYFPSKQALLSAVIADAVSELQARLAAQRAEAGLRSPAETVTETVRAATDLWWGHRAVLVASVELGAQVPEVYDRNLASIDSVAAATAELLDLGPDDAALVRTLVLMTERNFYDLARHSRPRAAYDELAARLAVVWLRALRLDG